MRDKFRYAVVAFANADLAMAAFAVLHALLSVFFGILLIYSGLNHNQGSSSTYDLIRDIPGWPTSVGVAYLVLGLVELWARYREDRWGWAALAYGLDALLTALYAALYAVGTAQAHSSQLLGPQIPYLILAALYTVHSVFSAARWILGR